MRQSRGETLGHGPGPPLAAMRDVQCVQMGIAVSAHSQARVCVWPPCAFAPATRVRGSFFCAFSEGLRCGTAPDDVGVASRGCKISAHWVGFSARTQGAGRTGAPRCVGSERLTPYPRRPDMFRCPKEFLPPPQGSVRPS